MTSTISEDALKGQQSRIMKAMRAATQPQQGSDLRDIASALTTQNQGGANYFDTMRKFGQEQAQTAMNAEMGIYEQMKEQVARGDAEAKGVDSAIVEIAGNDPKIYASILEDLHNDPEPVNARNAKSKVMKYAADRGIVPLSLQKEKQSMRKIESDMAIAAKGGESPAAVREYEYFNSLSPEDQRKYIRVKRTGGDEALDITLGKKGAESYAAEQTKIQEAETFLDNVDVAREKLAKAKLTGPIYGRVGKAASDPAYVDFQGSKNGLTLLAKSIYAMPSANFSDADRDFLDDITGGKFPSGPAMERTIDRLELLAQKAIRNSKKNQRNILERKTYNADAPVEEVPTGGTVTPKKVKFDDLPE